MDPNRLKSNPLLIDLLRPELGGKVVKAVVQDMERARREKEEKAKRAAPDAPAKRRNVP